MLCVCASRATDTTRTQEQYLTSTTSEYLSTPIMLYVNTTDYVDFALFTVTRHIIISNLKDEIVKLRKKVQEKYGFIVE